MFNMAAILWLTLLTSMTWAAQEDPLRIEYPSVVVHAKETGDFTMLSGFNGDIKVHAGPNNTGRVIFEGDDLQEIFQMVLSLPPVWQNNSLFGYVGEFQAGNTINKQLKALDPEGTHVTYTLVAGALPPGVKLESSTGNLKGITPDADLTYTFTVRATDQHGKFADSVFKMVIRGVDSCERHPCQHEGVCVDESNGFKCSCVHPYGGHTCTINCQTHSLGVSASYKQVPDAQLSGYLPYSSDLASNGRVSGGGWHYINTSSWLQVDLGNETDIHGFQMQGCNSYSYTRSYYVSTSVDGDLFTDYTGTSNKQFIMTGSDSSVVTANLPTPLSARFVRFHPISFYGYNGYVQCMRVDILGCYREK